MAVYISIGAGGVVLMGVSAFQGRQSAARNARGLCARCRGSLPADEHDVVLGGRVCIGCSDAQRGAWLWLLVGGWLVGGIFALLGIGHIVEQLIIEGGFARTDPFMLATIIGIGALLRPAWKDATRPVANRAVLPRVVPGALASGRAAEWERQALRHAAAKTKR